MVNTTEKYYKENGSELLINILKSEEIKSPDVIQFPLDPILYYFKDGDKYIGVDNTTHNCWVEEFDTLEEVLKWINGE
ncbi:MAG: hypothetical protein JEZ05_08190 [Tenericutes bacterium]|nr:hypothetical protein [Mycoplasmatota bacterium]